MENGSASLGDVTALSCLPCSKSECDVGGFRSQCQVFFFFTLVTGPRRSLSLKLSDARVYEPEIRARLGERVRGRGVPVAVPGLFTFY